MKIGVLAVQGAFIEHEHMIEKNRTYSNRNKTTG